MARKSRKNQAAAACSAPEQTVYLAAAYVRLSRDDAKRGDSLETQRDIIENFIAASPDIRLTEVYSDNQKTGTNFDRPGFTRMLADAEAGRINCIIVKDLSRFGRNAIDASYYIERQLPALGVRFISVTDSFDTLDNTSGGAGSPCGGILLPLKLVIAESYALDISRKCRSVQQQNIRDGRFVGRMAPYGYAKDPLDCHHLVVDEEAAVVVRQIFNNAACGMSFGEIIRSLNDGGIPSPSHYKMNKGLIANPSQVGKPYWQKRIILDILSNRAYVGDMVQGKTRTVNHKETAVDKDEWVCVPNTHEPIVSREQFERVLHRLQANAEKGRDTARASVPYSLHVFKGKVFCAHCGRLMGRHRQNKDGVYWFRCETQWQVQENACFPVSIKEAELQRAVFELLTKHAQAILGGYIRIEREAPALDAADEKELGEINARLAKSGEFLKSLFENMLEGLITAEEFPSMKAGYQAEIDALSKRADEIRIRRRERNSGREAYRDFADAVSDALANQELRADIADRLIEKILVRYNKSFEIVLRYQDEFSEEAARVG